MGIELSNLGLVSPPEASALSRAPNGNQPNGSEWASILGYLFQIEPPVDEAPGPTPGSEPEPTAIAVAPREELFFLIGFSAFANTLPSEERVDAGELVETDASIEPETTVPIEAHEAPPEATDGFELSSDIWTVLPTPVSLPTLPPAPPPPIPNQNPPHQTSAPTSPEALPTQLPQSPPPAGPREEPVTVEAVFRLSTESPETPRLDAPSGQPAEDSPRSIETETKSPQGRMPEPHQGDDTRPGSPSENHSGHARSDADDRKQHSESDAKREFPKVTKQEPPLPNEPAVLTEKTPFSLPTPPHTRSEWPQPITSHSSSSTVPALKEVTDQALSLERRPSPLQFQLRLTPDDFGAPSANSNTEVRLNLLQRGEEVLMKIQGGSETVARNAEAQWESLVDRLKPHGLEATSRLFAPELAKRDGDPRAPQIVEHAMPDSGSNPGDEQRRFNQEQQHQQQRQNRQRYPTKTAAGKSPFSLEHGVPGT